MLPCVSASVSYIDRSCRGQVSSLTAKIVTRSPNFEPRHNLTLHSRALPRGRRYRYPVRMRALESDGASVPVTRWVFGRRSYHALSRLR
jgi:hypothetical protein